MNSRPGKQHIRRVEDGRILTGGGRYVDDVRLDGMLHAAFVRSPFPHAAVVGIDAEDALEVLGVVAVLTARDLEGVVAPMTYDAPETLRAPPYPAIAASKVRFVGDPVAVVLATSRAEAEDGVDVVEVEYEPLEPVPSADAALQPGAPLLFEGLGTNLVHERSTSYGDVDGAFAAAGRVITATFSQHRYANVPMETRGGVADFDADANVLEFYGSHQSPHGLRAHLARLLRLDLERVHVQTRDIGGSFGQKGFVDREAVVIAAASRIVARPVKWIEDRSENLMVGGHAREETFTVDAAVSNDGRILGLAIDMTLDAGAYPVVPFPVSMITTIVGALFPGPYRITNYRFDARIALTNKASYVAYRGPWESETWVRERVLDITARQLGLDPVVVRRVNLWPDDHTDRRLAAGPPIELVSPVAALDCAVDRLGYVKFRMDQAAARSLGEYIGVGFASFIEPAPGPPEWGPAIGVPRPPQRAVARLDDDGGVTLVTSQSPHGQSHETTLAQVVATTLDVSFDDVRVEFGDTRVTPFALVGTGGSRAATLATGAAEGAARLLRDRATWLGADVLGVDPDRLEVRGGGVRAKDDASMSIPFAELAEHVRTRHEHVTDSAEPGLMAVFDFESPRGGWTHATHCCVVRVDVESGLVELLRYLVVEDCGRIINRPVVDGQIRGGVVQGLGGVLWERAAYDDDAQFVASTFMDYVLPTAAEVPDIEIVHLGDGRNAEVARGVGEGGAIGAPAALTNAVEDALAPFDVRITEQFLPPVRILELLGVIESAGAPK